jgi:hypothetical protein
MRAGGCVSEIKRGMQIAYIPRHAEGDIGHPDVEFGFVTSIRGGFAFCRYWSKRHPGQLRTTANSEATPLSLITPHISQPQSKIDKLLDTMM